MSKGLFLAILGPSEATEEQLQEAMTLLRLDPDAQAVWSPFDREDPEGAIVAEQVVWFSMTNR